MSECLFDLVVGTPNWAPCCAHTVQLLLLSVYTIHVVYALHAYVLFCALEFFSLHFFFGLLLPYTRRIQAEVEQRQGGRTDANCRIPLMLQQRALPKKKQQRHCRVAIVVTAEGHGLHTIGRMWMYSRLYIILYQIVCSPLLLIYER